MPKQLIMNTDPTRTTLLRRQFLNDMLRRFKALQKAITELVVTDDVFGLEELVDKKELRKQGLSILQQPKAFQFLTNPQKIQEYQKWMQIQINTGLLSVDGLGKPWTATYIESAYKKGMLRAYTDTNKSLLTETPQFLTASREQFLRTAFGQPELLSKIELLSLRAFEQLKGVTTTMSSQMSRILATGLSRGDGAAKIARELNKSVVKLTRTRARTIARTEIINAHAEGQLDSFELLGVDEVGAVVEWSTAGDERVCVECADMEGKIFTIDEARGLIPLHPNCRCAWIPAPQTKKQKQRKKRERAALEKRLPIFKKSLTKKATEQSILQFAGDTSEKFQAQITRTFNDYSKKVKNVLHKRKYTIKAGDRMTNILPELKGLHPRGWSASSTFDNIDCLQWQSKNLIAISEKWKRAGEYVNSNRAVGALNHEVGHAFNTSIKKNTLSKLYSDTSAFQNAYYKDLSKLNSASVETKQRVAYFMQESGGPAGRDETFAECFANVMGREINGGMEMDTYFNNSLSYVRDLVE